VKYGDRQTGDGRPRQRRIADQLFGTFAQLLALTHDQRAPHARQTSTSASSAVGSLTT
jgi:hypothetical protein